MISILSPKALGMLRAGELWVEAPPVGTARDKAARFWQAMNLKQRRAIMTDVPMAQKEAGLLERAACLPFYFGVHAERGMEMLAWLTPTGKGARTAAIHFASICREKEAAMIYANVCLAMLDYDTLIATMPCHWHGARELARSLGFRKRAVLVKACYLADRERCVDAALYTLEVASKPRLAELSRAAGA